MSRSGFARLFVFVACGALASSVSAAGTGSLAGVEKFKVSRCGSASGGTNVTLTIDANNSFTASFSGDPVTGTAATVGRNITLSIRTASRRLGKCLAKWHPSSATTS